MVVPLIAAGVIALGSGIAQYMTSKAAREASAQELQKMKELYEKIQLPDFKPEDFTPEDYAVVQKYVPEQAPFIEEVAPQTIQGQSEGAIRGRQAQFAALDRLRQVGAGKDPFQDEAIQQAQLGASKAAGSQRDALMQQYARRGLLGSGMELAGNLQSQSDQFGRSASVGLQGSMERYRNGLEAMRNAGNLGGEIRNQDIEVEGKNMGVINSFNQRNTSRKQELVNQQADTRNQAQQYNIGQAQGIANQNVSGRNAAKQAMNANKQTQFVNQMDMARSKAGLGAMARNDIMGAAADKNQMIQGVANAGQGIAMGTTKQQPASFNVNDGTPTEMFNAQTGKPRYKKELDGSYTEL